MALPLVISSGDPGHLGDHEEIHDILQNVEISDLWTVARFLTDILANRGAAGVEGSLFLSNNEGASGSLSVDTGSSWEEIWKLMPNAIFSLLTQGSPADNIGKWHVPACIVGKSGAQAIASSALTSETNVSWDDESGANHINNEGTNLHSITSNTGRFFATRDGIWNIGAFIKWEASAAGDRNITLEKNSTKVLARDEREATGGADNMVLGGALVELEQGDYVRIQVSQNSGGDLNVEASSYAWFNFVSDE